MVNTPAVLTVVCRARAKRRPKILICLLSSIHPRKGGLLRTPRPCLKYGARWRPRQRDQSNLQLSRKTLIPMRKTSDSRSRNSILEETQAALTDLSGDQVQAQTGMRRQELDSINRDQGRIRENMKTLKGSAEEKDLVQRYTRQLNSQEDRLATLNKETADLQTQQSQEQQKLEAMVQQITI